MVDVYEYKEKMMMPKLVICGANDEFFLPTDTRFSLKAFNIQASDWSTIIHCSNFIG